MGSSLMNREAFKEAVFTMGEHQNTRQLTLKVGLLQSLMLTLAGLVFFLNQSQMAMAALAGTAIGLLGTSAFALVTLPTGRESSAGRIVFNAYIAQASKYMFIFAGLVKAYTALPGIDQQWNVLALLGALFLSQIVYVLAPSLGSTTSRPEGD